MKNRLRTHRFLCAAVLFALCGLSGGCGSGSRSVSASGSQTGRATFSVTWPQRSRMIPDAANSIVVTFTNDAKSVATQLLARPAQGGTSTVSFENLPVTSLIAKAVAFPNADGTGTAQAQASLSVAIVSGQTTPVTLTLASTIDHLEIGPANPTVAFGETAALTATAKDAAGNVVLTSASKIQWNSVNPAFATVDNSGVLSGEKVGTAQVTATDTESGKSASMSVPVIVRHGIYIADSGNNRIVRIDDMSGAGWTEYNMGGGFERYHEGPSAVFVTNDGHIFVTDPNHHCLVRMDNMQGKNKITYGTAVGDGWLITPPPGQFFGPLAVFVADDGRIYLGEGSRIIRIDDMQGMNWTTYGYAGNRPPPGAFGTVYDVFVASDNRIYAANEANGSLDRMDDMQGTNWIDYGGYGSSPNSFGEVLSVKVGKDRKIYVMNEDSIVRIDDMKGTNRISYGSWGHGVGQFYLPQRLTIADDGRIYVADYQRIVRIDDISGTNWTTFGTEGSGGGQFYHPTCVCVR